MNRKKDKNITYFVIVVVFVLALGLIPLAITVSDSGHTKTETKNKVSLQSFDIVDMSSSTNPYASIEKINNDTITIQGRVVENTNG